MTRGIARILAVVACSMAAWPAVAAEISSGGRTTVVESDIDRVPSARGMTGLFEMQSAYTLRPGEVRLNAVANYQTQESALGDTTTLYIPVSLVVGLAPRWEVAVLGKSRSVEFDSFLGTDTKDSGLGDAELMTKYRFHTQSDNLPAMAFGVGGFFPTGTEDIPNADFREVESSGFRLMFMMSTEVRVFEDSPVGLHVEVQKVWIDPSDSSTVFHDTYDILSAGIVSPISDDNRLVLIGEVSRIRNRDIVDATSYAPDPVPAIIGNPGGEVDTLTAGIRYRWKYMNFGLALRKESPRLSGLDDSDQILVSFGLGF